MKTLFTILLFVSVITQIIYSQEPTYAGLPDSSHVLVVYNELSTTSIAIKNYYQNARGIPESNIVKLNQLVDDDVYDPETQTWHSIVLDQGEEGEKELIKDEQGSLFPIYRHAWIYFIERIAEPIANHLRTTIVNGDTLKNTIRFIVLCKGIPFRILTIEDYASSCNQNVSVDALLCFLGEDIDDPYHLLDYLNEESPDTNGTCQGTYNIANPYYNADPTFSMDHQFLPNHYSSYNSHLARDVTLSYLITHLDAMSLDDVKNMIDSSIAAINSSGYDWFIDSDPTPCKGSGQILNPSDTKDIFDYLGITNKFIDEFETIYTTHNKPVMSYSSNGIHTTFGTNPPFPEPCDLYFPEDYIQTQLDFTYIAGSVFNTAESFNVNTLGTDPPIRRGGS